MQNDESFHGVVTTFVTVRCRMGYKWKEIGERHAAFDCATPKAIPSPFYTQQMLQDGSITEAQAHALKQSWLKELNSMDKERLDQELQSCEEIRQIHYTTETPRGAGARATTEGNTPRAVEEEE